MNFLQSGHKDLSIITWSTRAVAPTQSDMEEKDWPNHRQIKIINNDINVKLAARAFYHQHRQLAPPARRPGAGRPGRAPLPPRGYCFVCCLLCCLFARLLSDSPAWSAWDCAMGTPLSVISDTVTCCDQSRATNYDSKGHDVLRDGWCGRTDQIAKTVPFSAAATGQRSSCAVPADSNNSVVFVPQATPWKTVKIGLSAMIRRRSPSPLRTRWDNRTSHHRATLPRAQAVELSSGLITAGGGCCRASAA